MLFKKKKKELQLGWSGNYQTWEEASLVTTGYNYSLILEKVKNALLKVKKGEAVYERDSVLFDKKEYSWPLLAMLLSIAIENQNKLNVVDFGGSLGSTYFQNKDFLLSLSELKWNIVEQKHFVEVGKENFQDDYLKFYEGLEECIQATQSKVLIASSVVQYISKPYALLKQFKECQFDYLIFDRTAFIEADKDIISVQRVPKEIYEASYPCWFFNYTNFVNYFEDRYTFIADFESAFDSSRFIEENKVYWKGIVFKRK